MSSCGWWLSSPSRTTPFHSTLAPHTVLVVADDPFPVEEEHLESIPWASLVAQTRDRPLLVYVAAGAVVALVVGLLVARTARPGTSPTSLALPVESAASVVPSSTTLLSEADLRAELTSGNGGERAAVARAEWFVTDYFTSDGPARRDEAMAEALGRAAPPLEGDATTYVEWARAWLVEEEDDGRYRVAVSYRAITDTQAGFVRGAVRSVAVRVQVSPDGGTRVVELPEPTSLPAGPPPAYVPPPQQVPAELAARALEEADKWGDPVEALEAVELIEGWRVRVVVEDDAGVPWSLVVWLDP